MKRIALAALSWLVLTAPAVAAMIDFTDPSAFAGANYRKSFSALIDGYTLTLTAAPLGARLYWDADDGLGVRFGYENDEIEGLERLRIAFSTPVYLASALLTDLFNDGYLERGSYQLNGAGPWIGFQADPGQTPGTNGELLLPFAPHTLVESITFRAPGWLPLRHQAHEFSVAAIEASAVPVPAAAWLLGSGLLGLAALRRQKSGG